MLGVDFGTKRVGLALSDPGQLIASPLEILQRSSPVAESRRYRDLVEEMGIVGIVVGLPMHVSGAEGASARAAREYAGWLHRTVQRPIMFWDERYTSAVAEERLLEVDVSRKRRKKLLDKLAAQIFLQSYLDEKNRRLQEVEESEDEDGDESE